MRKGDTNEDMGWLRIQRVELSAHNSGMIDQAKAFMIYALAVKRMSRHEHWDMVFATSSRLMTGVLGAYIANRYKVPFYLDIRDIFTDIMSDIFKNSMFRYLLPVFDLLERYCFESAAKINVVSSAFLEHVEQLVPEQKFSVYTNGIDTEFLNYDYTKIRSSRTVPVILYAGNIGEARSYLKLYLMWLMPWLASKISDYW